MKKIVLIIIAIVLIFALAFVGLCAFVYFDKRGYPELCYPISDEEYLSIKSKDKLETDNLEYVKEHSNLLKIGYDIITFAEEDTEKYFSSSELYESFTRSMKSYADQEYWQTKVYHHNDKAIFMFRASSSPGELLEYGYVNKLYLEKQNDNWVVVERFFPV